MASPYVSRKKPDYLARAVWHDYTSRRIYLVTFNTATGIQPLATITSAGNHNEALSSLSPIGEAIAQEITRITDYYPFVSILDYCVMPDHIHIILYVKQKTEISLGQIVSSLKANSRKAVIEKLPHLSPFIESNGLFKKGFNDRIVSRENQLETFIRYVKDNPKRYWLKKNNPEFFNRCNKLVINGQEYDFYGNFLLLRHCSISAVRISRSYSPTELEARFAEWDEVMRNGGVLVSPFISPKEKEVRDRGIDSGANIISLVSNGFPERFKPSGRDFDLCTAGRLLIIAPTNHNTRKENLSREQCLKLNALAETIATQASTLALRHRNPHR